MKTRFYQLVYDLRGLLIWSKSIGIKFLSITPISTLSVIVLTILVQVFQLMASLLPLKVIILLGSPEIPDYFPASISNIGRDQLIISMTVAAGLSYLLYLFLDRIVEKLCISGARVLITRNEKIEMFANQKTIAKEAYRRYSRSLSGIVFSIVGAFCIAKIYPGLLVVLVSYISLAMIILTLIYCTGRISSRDFMGSMVPISTNIASVGFFTAFGFMVLDFLVNIPVIGSRPNVIIAMISILLVRQWMGWINNSILEMVRLFGEKQTLNAIFFHGHPMSAQANIEKNPFFEFLEVESRENWIKLFLESQLNEKVDVMETSWLTTGVPGVVALSALIKTSNENTKAYLFKVFDEPHKMLYENESLLYRYSDNQLPAPKLISRREMMGFGISLFDIQESLSKLPSPQEGWGAIMAIRKALLTINPDAEMKARYLRSKQTLVQRIADLDVKRLTIACDDLEKLESIKQFSSNLGTYQNLLKHQPLQIFNSALFSSSVYRQDQSRYVSINWGSWSLEPLGSGWPTGDRDLEILEEYLMESRGDYSQLIGLKAGFSVMTSLLYAIEVAINQHNYILAIELIEKINKRDATSEASVGNTDIQSDILLIKEA